MEWRRVTGAPPVHDPGTVLECGINTDWLGHVVEAAGGVSLAVAVKDGTTGPLGMDATSFHLDVDTLAVAVPVHLDGADGSWAPSEIELNQAPE